MGTLIIYNNVTKKYARLAGSSVQWEPRPEDATTYDSLRVREPLSALETQLGPALDGSLEVKDQIEEVNRIKDGRYLDSEQYEDGDDTDCA